VPLTAFPGFSSGLADTLERGRPPGKGGGLPAGRIVMASVILDRDTQAGRQEER
jgi:hypothetical protein